MYSRRRQRLLTMLMSSDEEDSSLPSILMDTIADQRTSYVFRTINNHNQDRLSILPIFPKTTHDRQYHLLLANVPGLFFPISSRTNNHAMFFVFL